MDATHNHQGILSEERMIERVHGIDRHKQFSTISVLNRQREEVQFQGGCREFGKYVEGLGPTDAVVLEASTGSFWWADQIEAKGARCFVEQDGQAGCAQLGEGVVGARGDGGVRDSHGVQADREWCGS
jgi:hypothetical protein